MNAMVATNALNEMAKKHDDMTRLINENDHRISAFRHFKKESELSSVLDLTNGEQGGPHHHHPLVTSTPVISHWHYSALAAATRASEVSSASLPPPPPITTTAEVAQSPKAKPLPRPQPTNSLSDQMSLLTMQNAGKGELRIKYICRFFDQFLHF